MQQIESGQHAHRAAEEELEPLREEEYLGMLLDKI